MTEQAAAPFAAPFAAAARRAGRAAVRRVVDLVLPPRCIGCGALVDAPGALCGTCWRGIDFITQPFCARCGLPFGHDAGEGAICGECARNPPPYERARAAAVYDDASRALILAFKHADRTDAAKALGGWLARAGADILGDADAIVPVPLHRRRLLARRYNQSALLAQALSRATGVPCIVDGMVRTRATPSQGRMDRTRRERNVRGAFAIRKSRAAALKGRHVVLVDDVLTTGATVSSCTRALLRGGAARVSVLALARVTRTG